MIDQDGRDLSKPIKPLDICEWEDMQIQGEAALLGASNPSETKDEQITRLGHIILRLSAEIDRLRLTYGEEVWTSVGHSKEENNFMRKVHEKERYMHQIQKS